MRTIDQVIAALPKGNVPELPAPRYLPPTDVDLRPRVALAVEDMRRHTTDEGYQVMAGLEWAGYMLQGHGFHRGHPENGDKTDVANILSYWIPQTVVMMDRKEWDFGPNDFRDPRARFANWPALGERDDVFKVTIIKEAQKQHIFHADTARIAGIHCWLTYAPPRIAKHLAGFLRPRHCIQVWHTVDRDAVPPYSPEGRKGCLLSGALCGGAYPLRRALVANVDKLPETIYKPHPGYGNRKCHTPDYLKLLSRFKVAICTSSIYSYPLRKHIESTACGCRVITDLANDEVLPGGIDENLTHIDPTMPPARVGELVAELLDTYDPERQEHYARLAVERYDYRIEGLRLAGEIEKMRRAYNVPTESP